jgi:hypothetical protein
VVVEDDDEDISEVVQPEPKGRGKTKVSASPATNGKPASKAKGKGKADSTVDGQKSRSDLVVIEELELVDDEPLVTKPLPPTKKGKTHIGTPPEEGEIDDTILQSELERTREERDLVRLPPPPLP